VRKSIPHLFADLTARLEDLSAVAVEGQRRDNARDMQSVLASHLRMGIAAVDATLGEIKRRLGDARD
jgi:hypothetical protein